MIPSTPWIRGFKSNRSLFRFIHPQCYAEVSATPGELGELVSYVASLKGSVFGAPSLQPLYVPEVTQGEQLIQPQRVDRLVDRHQTRGHLQGLKGHILGMLVMTTTKAGTRTQT